MNCWILPVILPEVLTRNTNALQLVGFMVDVVGGDVINEEDTELCQHVL